jgi:hypothetical protein
MRLLGAGCAAAFVVACGNARSTAPPGFVEACYGGRENMPRYVAFSDRRVAITLDATEKDWPALTDIVRQIAEEHGLQFFDTSESGPSLRAVMVYACHASGIFLSLDKQIWTAAPEPETRRDKVDVSLYTYRPDARFEPIARTLETRLQAAWKNRAKVERFPAVLPSKKALPDVVRAQLLQECSAASVPKPYYCEGF